MALDDGTGNDDHPHADIRNGENFISLVLDAIYHSAQFEQTAVILMFDEWGGFFEMVAPPRVPPGNPTIDPDVNANGNVLLGFRIPPIVISPCTRNRRPKPLINSTLFDHTYVLKLIECRFGLQPLTPRDASTQIGNLATVSNFSSPDYSVPALPAAPPVFAAPCPGGGGIFDASASAATEPAAS
jgi:phospholipase C